MSKDLTPRQQILLWDLIARGGSALQKDIKPDVKPAERKPLEQAGLVAVTKEDRSIRLSIVEEKAWDYLGANPPALLKSGEGSKYDRPILQFVLEQMAKLAQANEVGLAQIVLAKRIRDEAEEAEASPVTEDARRPAGDLQARIRDAFFAIAGRPASNHVRLKKLRAHLADIPRERVDEALVAMRREGRVSLSELSNPSDIAAEGDAALTIRGQQFHTIWIER